jgi:hypothetical protein
MPYHCRFHWPVQSSPPSITQALVRHPTGSGRARRSGTPAVARRRLDQIGLAFLRSSGVCQGLTAPPRSDLRFVRDDQPEVHPDHAAEAAAGFAGAERRVEREGAGQRVGVVDVAVGAMQARSTSARRLLHRPRRRRRAHGASDMTLAARQRLPRCASVSAARLGIARAQAVLHDRQLDRLALSPSARGMHPRVALAPAGAVRPRLR